MSACVKHVGAQLDPAAIKLELFDLIQLTAVCLHTARSTQFYLVSRSNSPDTQNDDVRDTNTH